MRIPTDLHDDDLRSRLRLIDELRAVREDRGVSTKDLDAAFGVCDGTTRAMERRTTWEARTVFRYARALGRRLTFHLDNIDTPDDDDIVAIVLAAGDTSTPERADRVHWRQVCNELRRARRATHTAVAMAARLGVRETAVHYWEANPDGSTIISAQRHARGLGGTLGWTLTETAAHATPRPRPTTARR